jgi:hypothetical protein
VKWGRASSTVCRRYSHVVHKMFKVIKNGVLRLRDGAVSNRQQIGTPKAIMEDRMLSE